MENSQTDELSSSYFKNSLIPSTEDSENYIPTQSMGESQLDNLRDETEEDDLEEDRIFQRICTDDELKQMAFLDGDRCYITNCQKKFGLTTSKKQCKFCGHLVCEKHSPKHRPNPLDPKMYRRICILCEDKYLKKMLNQQFNVKRKQYNDQIRGIEAKIKEQIDKKKNSQNEFDHLVSLLKQDSGKYTIKKLEQSNKIKTLKIDIDQIKQNYQDDQEKVAQLESEIEEFKAKVQEKQEILDERASEQRQLQKKIQVAEQDIKSTQFIVEQIEKKITENNLIQEQIKVSKDNQISQQIQYQKQQQQMQQKLQEEQEEQQRQRLRQLQIQQQAQNEYASRQSNADDQSLHSSVFYPDPDEQEDQDRQDNSRKKKGKKKSKKNKKEGNEGGCGVDKCTIF